MLCQFLSRFSISLVLVGLCVLLPAGTSIASIVTFEIAGTADITLDGTFHAGEEFEVNFFVDDAEPDQFAFDSSRGAFGNVTATLTLLDSTLMVQDALALNINGLRQDQFPESIYLANDSNFFNQGFSLVPPAGTLVDVNQINPLAVDNVSGNWTGAGLAWQLEGGQTLRFNQASGLTITNAVPEPSLWTLLLSPALLLLTRRRDLNRIAVSR